MIQRIQSVYLFLAAVAMALYIFVPTMGLVTDSGNHVMGALAGVNGIDTPNYIFLLLEALIAIICIGTIFKFKDLKRQSTLCKVALTLTIGLIAVIFITWIMQKGTAIAVLTPWIALPFVAMVMIMMAHNGVKKDRKLLAESDRLR